MSKAEFELPSVYIEAVEQDALNESLQARLDEIASHSDMSGIVPKIGGSLLRNSLLFTANIDETSAIGTPHQVVGYIRAENQFKWPYTRKVTRQSRIRNHFVDAKPACISELYVEPDYQRIGIGTALFHCAIAHFPLRQPTSLTVPTINEAAINFGSRIYGPVGSDNENLTTFGNGWHVVNAIDSSNILIMMRSPGRHRLHNMDWYQYPIWHGGKEHL